MLYVYSWINLRGTNPPPPPYRNNLYKITYVINFSRYSLKIKGGGVATPPPTLLLWRPWHMRIYQFIHLFIYFICLCVFIHSFIQLFIHSQWYFNLFLCRSVVHVPCIVTISTGDFYKPTLNRNDMCI